jgi:hypothetical protein
MSYEKMDDMPGAVMLRAARERAAQQPKPDVHQCIREAQAEGKVAFAMGGAPLTPTEADELGLDVFIMDTDRNLEPYYFRPCGCLQTRARTREPPPTLMYAAKGATRYEIVDAFPAIRHIFFPLNC